MKTLLGIANVSKYIKSILIFMAVEQNKIILSIEHRLLFYKAYIKPHF